MLLTMAGPHLYPLQFEPILKPKVWGGRSLARFGKHLPPEVLIGESWELADLPADVPQGRSVIGNGPLAGQTLHQLMSSSAATLLGAARPSDTGGFPLLIKYLDARQNLSVQVHPDRDYVARHPGTHLKSEAWYVLDAEPGAIIYKGIKPGIGREELRDHLERGALVTDLVQVPVAAGDCHYLPSGTCHALGGGIVVAEIQTPSDTTFRLYDWGRTEREIHVEAALECLRLQTPHPIALPPPITTGSILTQPLLETPHFGMERVEVTNGGSFPIVTNDLPEVWLVLEGSATFESYSSLSVQARRGATVLIPAALNDAHAVIQGNALMLRVTLPSPLSGQIADE